VVETNDGKAQPQQYQTVRIFSPFISVLFIFRISNQFYFKQKQIPKELQMSVSQYASKEAIPIPNSMIMPSTNSSTAEKTDSKGELKSSKRMFVVL
jgi:hypothetical protein